jgi:GNAT superfamily N-acetyltransferase
MGAWCCWVGEVPVAFAYVVRFPHPTVKDIAKVGRIVVAPDYQGLSIASRFLEFLGGYYTERRNRMRITTLRHDGALPLPHLRRSPGFRDLCHPVAAERTFGPPEQTYVVGRYTIMKCHANLLTHLGRPGR